MTAYPHRIGNSGIEETDSDWGRLRLLAGESEGGKGYLSKYLPFGYCDLRLNPKASAIMNTESTRSVMVFSLLWDAYIGGYLVKEKTAARLTSGDRVEIKAMGKKAQVLLIGPGPSCHAHQLFEMNVMNVPRLTIPNAMQQLDSDGKLALKASYPCLEKQADAFLDFIAK